jgi:hypothetical protein
VVLTWLVLGPEQEDDAPAGRVQQTAGHIATTAASFRDFLLKPEILRAINDCAFEHPSKGRDSEALALECML